MNDKHVDELLDDLDRALSVQPSPSVTARVRQTIAERPARLTPWVRWVLAGATAAGAVVVAVLFLTPRQADVPPAATAVLSERPETIAVETAPQAASAPPAVQSASRARRPSIPSVGSSASSVRTRASREPEVQFSAEVQAGMAMLRAAAMAGRARADMFAPADTGPVVLTPTLVTLAPFEIDSVAPPIPEDEDDASSNIPVSSIRPNPENRSRL